MIPAHSFAVDDAVVEFFSERTKGEREEMLRIFKGLADSTK